PFFLAEVAARPAQTDLDGPMDHIQIHSQLQEEGMEMRAMLHLQRTDLPSMSEQWLVVELQEQQAALLNLAGAG
ncbi:MAG: hypothetical protein AAB034_00590, partial [Nitrospirota bacterium]